MTRWFKFRVVDAVLIGAIGVVAGAILRLAAPDGPPATIVGVTVACVLLAALVIFCYRGLLAAIRFYAEQADHDRLRLYGQIEALLWIHARVPLPRRLPPMRGMAVSPDAAALLVDLVEGHRPDRVVELGCGVSTLLMGHVLAKLGRGEVVAFDHDIDYAASFRGMVSAHALNSHVRILDAPLKPVRIGEQDWEYYDPSVLARIEPGSVDLLFVDGPPERPGRMPRYPALPLLSGALSAKAVIVVDDADRDDERAMVDRWMREFPGWKLARQRTEKGTVVLHRDPGSRPSPA